MSEPNQLGNKQLPDFNELNDRMIVEKTSTPIFVMKTNLDPKDSTVENPYYHGEQTKDPQALRDFFEKK